MHVKHILITIRDTPTQLIQHLVILNEVLQMENQLEFKIGAIKLTQEQIDFEVAQYFSQTHKEMLRRLNERALDRAFQLDMSRS